MATARRTGPLDAFSARAPDRVLPLALDVTDAASIDEARSAAEARFGAQDVLVNNAGYGIVGALEETLEGELCALTGTDFFGAVAVTRAFLPMMRMRGSKRGLKRGQGAIVMISSLGGQVFSVGFGPCSASKFPMEGLTEAPAQEVAPFGPHAMTVEPGQLRTDFAGGAMRAVPRTDLTRPRSAPPATSPPECMAPRPGTPLPPPPSRLRPPRSVHPCASSSAWTRSTRCAPTPRRS